jgi:hypothetical protein
VTADDRAKAAEVLRAAVTQRNSDALSDAIAAAIAAARADAEAERDRWEAEAERRLDALIKVRAKRDQLVADVEALAKELEGDPGSLTIWRHDAVARLRGLTTSSEEETA